jgi:hypothetical protein
MTELAIRETAAPAVRAELPVPPVNDIDSWTHIVGQVVKLANEIYDTPFIPDGLRGSAAAVSACILAGREMGLGPMTSLANIDVIRGKPTQKPLLMRAMILSSGHKWEDVENTDTRAVVRGRRKDESNWTTVTFTADQAKKAGLNLGNWPADKLYARASSRLAKHRFADVIMGIPYTPEDVEDGLDVEVTVTTDDDAPAIEAKPRTAQRKARTSPPPAQAATPSAVSAPPSGAGGDLPPLPGEEDAPGPETPGLAGPGAPEPVTPKQLTAIWTVLSEVFLFGKDERDEARKVCAHVVNRPLESSKDMSKQEAGTVLDTLAHWEAQAQREDESPRAYLKMMINATGGESGE